MEKSGAAERGSSERPQALAMERVANQAASSAHKPRQAPCRCRSNRILAPQKGALARPLYTFASQGHRRFQVYSHQYPACSVAGRGLGRFNDASLRHRQLTAKKTQLGETQPQKKTRKKKKKTGKKEEKRKEKRNPHSFSRLLVLNVCRNSLFSLS